MYNFAITIYFLQVLVSFLFEISFLIQVHPKQSSRVTKTQRFTECEIIKKQKHYYGEKTSICFVFLIEFTSYKAIRPLRQKGCGRVRNRLPRRKKKE